MRFGKELRLARKKDFTEIFNNGEKLYTEHLSIHYLRKKETVKFACIVSSKVGKATVRNRIKRSLREEFRVNLGKIPDDIWLIVRMKYPREKFKTITRAELKELRKEFKEMLDKINKDNPYRFNGIFYNIFTFPIKLYKWIISPLLPSSCIFYPSCSDYALESISLYGPLRGTGKALYRILRCNPFNKGGYDPP